MTQLEELVTGAAFLILEKSEHKKQFECQYQKSMNIRKSLFKTHAFYQQHQTKIGRNLSKC